MKKGLAWILAAVMLFSLVACGGKKEEDEKAAGTEAQAGEETAETKTAEKKEEGSGAKEGKIRVGFSQMDNNGAWRVVETEDMKAVAGERGYELVYTDAQSQTSKQLSDIEDLIAQEVDYLVIAPKETTGLERGLEEAKEAGIPVILIDRCHDGKAGEDYVTYIASDFVYQGYECGQALAKALDGNGKVVVIEGQPGGSDAIERQEGFDKAMEEYPDIEVIASQPGEYSRSKAQSVMESFLQTYGDEIDAVFSHDDERAQGAITAIEANNLKAGEDIKIAGIDGQKSAIQAIIDGKMTAVVTCSPRFGTIVFDTIERLIAGETLETYIQLEDYVIDSSNAEAELENGF